MGSSWPGDQVNIRRGLGSRLQPGLITWHVSSFSPKEGKQKGHIYQRLVINDSVEEVKCL